jgi:uncharacterized repeat protein (TIGR03847 family)
LSSSFDFDAPERFCAGTIGEPGQRVFFLQMEADGLVVSLRLEKQQVAALAEYLSGILDDLPTVDPADVADAGDLVEPVVAEWVVGSLGVAWEEASDRVVLVAEEAVAIEMADEDDEDEEDDEDDLDVDDEDDAPHGATARIRLTRAQVRAFVTQARELVSAGRPACPLCGQPMDPDGHVCPRSNGHRH